MNGKKYEIRLQAKIDEGQKNIKALNKQISSMQKHIDKLEIKVKTKGTKKATTEFKTIKEALQSVDKSLGPTRRGLEKIEDTLVNGNKIIEKFRTKNNQVLTLITKMEGKEKTYTATLNRKNKEIEKNANSIAGLNAKYKSYADAQKTLGINLNSGWEKLSGSINTNGDAIEKWTNDSGKVVTLTGKLVDGQTRWNGTLKEVNKSVGENAKEANKWKYSWSKAFQSFGTYMSVSTVFYQIKNAIKTAIYDVVELDDALVELKKVTDLEGESLDRFAKKAYNMSEIVAKTGVEMIQAATEFAKSGYNEEQILQLGEIALMYTNIADEQVSAAEASEFMVAQMKAFNIEADDAVHIIDAVNEVANKYAVSSADIANNLGKSSAVMANAGNTFEQMIGLLTAGTEITRSASKVANGLKTITLRLQGMNDEGEKDLKLVSQMEAMFKKLGISVYKADGSLKNTFEILQTLAPVYQKATTAEKAFITETIAGKWIFA